MAQVENLDFDGFVSKKKGERAGGPEGGGHDYAYISDKQTRAAFERIKPVELAVTSTVRMFKQVWRNQLLGNAVKVSDRQFPRIQGLVQQCADTLHITPPTVYIVNNPVLNAATYGTNEESFIMVHSALIDHYSDEELLTVIGHECGHIHNSHVVYLTALHYLTRMAGVFVRWAVEPALVALRAWSRRAEITSDRAGMLCAKSDIVAMRSLTKLALGSKKLYEEFNLDVFLEQYEEGKDGMGKYMEMFATHPWLPKRVLAMRVFAESELYRKAAGIGTGGLAMNEVDDRVRALLKGGRMMLDAFREKKLDVTVALSELSESAGRLGARSLKERIDRDLVHKLEEDRFHLVVVGEFNHGKTTFVNALLGQKVLPVGVTPTTATIHHIKYADTPEATVAYSSGRRESIPFERAKSFAVGGGSSTEDVDFLEVGVPAQLLKERILLVDTPGVNDLSLQRADITYSYIPRADAVLFLLDAGQILKESERVFLEDKLLKASRDKIVFVVTKWDLLSPDEQGEALAYARDKLAKLVKDPLVFPTSAEKALAGDVAHSGLPELMVHLTRFLAEERGRILLDNALGEGLAVLSLLTKGIDAKRRTVAMKGEELERRIALLSRDLEGQAGTIEQRRSQIREEVMGIKVGARKDLDRFVDDTIRQIPNVIDSAKPEDLRQYLPGFLEETFKRWAEAESKEIAGSLEALAEKTIALVREDAHDAAKRVGDTLGTDVKRLDVQIDTFGYDVGIFALFTLGLGVMFANALLGGMLALAAPILALVVKDRVEGEYKRRAKEMAPEVLRAAAAKVAPKLDEMIGDFGDKLDAWVVTAGEELHREVLEVLNSTQEARKSGVQDEGESYKEIEEQAGRLKRSGSRIEDLRAALWAPPKVVVRVADDVGPPAPAPVP